VILGFNSQTRENASLCGNGSMRENAAVCGKELRIKVLQKHAFFYILNSILLAVFRNMSN